MPAFGVYNKSDLDRVGLARQEQLQDAKPGKISPDEALLRTLDELQSFLKDARKGLRTRWNNPDGFEFSTAAGSLSAGNGEFFDCHNRNGGIPWDSFTVDSVGGGGATMQVMVNERGFWIPVVAGDVWDNGEIWSIRVRVTTAGAGTARLFVTSYVPGLGGYSGV